MAASMRNHVVVILGATGTGKTKLSLEIAKLFNGEIISADALQLYKGLDIITNKATPEELQQCKHHLIDYLSPLKQNNTVVQYRDSALPIIDSLLSQKKLPVVVGGTNYYIESLLWKHLIDTEDITRAYQNATGGQTKCSRLNISSIVSQMVPKPSSDTFDDTKIRNIEPVDQSAVHRDCTETAYKGCTETQESVHFGEDTPESLCGNSGREYYEQLSSRELHERLLNVDPVTARQLHPKNKRKLIRALEVYDSYGVPVSEVYKIQHGDGAGKALSGPLRYKDACVFWLHCDQQVLDKRLDDRVDEMMTRGLVEELTNFHRLYNESRLQEDRTAIYSTGIFQSIGFKEFHEYLILTEADRQTDHGQKLLEKCVTSLKIAHRITVLTVYYFRCNQFEDSPQKICKIPGPCPETMPAVYKLDCTDVATWQDTVYKPAVTILSALRNGDPAPYTPLSHEGEKIHQYEYNTCQYCDVTATTKETWQKHVMGCRHKKAVTHYKREVQRLSQTLDNLVQQEQSKDAQENSLTTEMGKSQLT